VCLTAADVEALSAYVAAHLDTALVEPLAALEVVFDRGAACALLASMPAALRSGGGGAHAPLAAPASVELTSWDADHVAAALQGAHPRTHMRIRQQRGLPDVCLCARTRVAGGVPLPCLLKPRVACGAPGSHAMALLRRASGAASARVALPALAQAFVPHGCATFHKVYVLGQALFTARRRSLPPLPASDALPDDAPDALPFDALASLPHRWHGDATACNDADASAAAAAAAAAEPPPLDMAAVHAAAAWLRAATGLRLFGFDVVIDASSGAHAIVDLNYFPSCAATPGAPDAMAALLRGAVREHAAGAGAQAQAQAQQRRG
jgi:hypothetical protein